jgi:hypothetical protein
VKRFILAFILSLVIVAALPLLSADDASDARYYPLAVGNVWTYEVRLFSPKAKRSSVKWTVTHSDIWHGRNVYQVWPKPMDVDDEAMLLAITPQGIVETTDETYLLRFPITAGDTWTQTPRGSNRSLSFLVRSANQPCQVNGHRVSACVVVEQDDSATGLKTVTTYGRDIGPVHYDYYKQQAGKDNLIQSVSLVAHKVAVP